MIRALPLLLLLGCVDEGPGALPDDAYSADADAFAWPEAGPRDALATPDAWAPHTCGPGFQRPAGCRGHLFRGTVWDCGQLDPCATELLHDYLLACCECAAEYCLEPGVVP